MATVIDRSDYLPAIFGQPAAPDHLHAHDLADYFTTQDRDLLAVAAAGSAPAGQQLKRSNRVMDNPDLGGRELLAELMPAAVWYQVENLDAQVQFIVDGDRVWISGRRFDDAKYSRPREVARADALEAIYALLA